MSKKKWASSC